MTEQLFDAIRKTLTDVTPPPIDIVDRNGFAVPDMTWESVQADFGVGVVRTDPPEGVTAFRLVRLIFDSSAETNWRLYVWDEDGRPLPGVAAFLGIQPPSGTDLPPDMAPILYYDIPAQPEGYPNRALLLQPNELNFTSVDGYIQHSLGSGSNYIPPGPATHWCWIAGQYSDVPTGFGMWDNHLMFWPVFQRVTSEVEPPPPPPPEPEPVDLSEVVKVLEQYVAPLERIADGLGALASWVTRP